MERSILRMTSIPKSNKGQIIEINRWSGDRSRPRRRKANFARKLRGAERRAVFTLPALTLSISREDGRLQALLPQGTGKQHQVTVGAVAATTTRTPAKRHLKCAEMG
eukprot:COSAG02_NODE_7710_length_2881_cov_3.761409_2_plen_107_part_00